MISLLRKMYNTKVGKENVIGQFVPIDFAVSLSGGLNLFNDVRTA